MKPDRKGTRTEASNPTGSFEPFHIITELVELCIALGTKNHVKFGSQITGPKNNY
ncbi:MAG TPA: hypothetical protein VIP70_12840 [Nitrososphaeraceae archaeon]